jgi:hypothetical protein
VTTGVVVVVVGWVVVVVLVAASLLPDESDVVGVIVVVVVLVDVVAALVWEASVAPDTPGCSFDTATPISAVAPVATRIAVRVNQLTRACAR